MKTIYLVGGPMGVGKTTACRLMKELLQNSVFLDGDWCWDAHPFWVTEETKKMVLDNICHLLNNFIHCSAYETVIFCWVMHEQSIIDHILRTIDVGDCVVKTVSLVCEKEALRQRLKKDIDRGIRQEDVTLRSLARLPLYRKLNTVQIDTTGMLPAEIAHKIIAADEKGAPMLEIQDKNYRPTLEEIAQYIQNPTFMQFCSEIKEKYKCSEKIEYSACSWEKGWNLKFKKAGKTLCTIYPRKNYFKIMIVIGTKEKASVEAILPDCTTTLQQIYSQTKEGNNQRWLMLDLKEQDLLYNDAIRLIKIRHTP